jgi:hypothetical protein
VTGGRQIDDVILPPATLAAQDLEALAVARMKRVGDPHGVARTGQIRGEVNFKHLRKTKHTHHPVDDARGNAEALLQMKAMGLKISFT